MSKMKAVQVRKAGGLKLGVRALRLDASHRRIFTSDGNEIEYDRLLLCLGAASRRLTCRGSDLPGVHCLRAIEDVPRIQEALRDGSRAVSSWRSKPSITRRTTWPPAS
jgi:NAD(P)H-nitrite reductase large subunit